MDLGLLKRGKGKGDWGFYFALPLRPLTLYLFQIYSPMLVHKITKVFRKLGV